MQDENKAMVKALVPVAWADGTFQEREREMLEGLLAAFGATPEEVAELKTYADSPKTVDDIPITDLGYDDRRVLLQHAVLLSYADGEQKDSERVLIEEMVKKLRIPSEEARLLKELAASRAKRLLGLTD